MISCAVAPRSPFAAPNIGACFVSIDEDRRDGPDDVGHIRADGEFTLFSVKDKYQRQQPSTRPTAIDGEVVAGLS
jgi:hypothetical protein